MHNQVKIAVLALSFYSPLLLAQNAKTDQNAATSMDENAFGSFYKVGFLTILLCFRNKVA